MQKKILDDNCFAFDPLLYCKKQCVMMKKMKLEILRTKNFHEINLEGENLIHYFIIKKNGNKMKLIKTRENTSFKLYDVLPPSLKKIEEFYNNAIYEKD